MKLLCDEMLKGLARWLRAAGHDTEVAGDGDADRDLLARARAEQRLLVTRDRKILEHRNARDHVCLLECNDLESCAREITHKTGLVWQYKPFSRCLVCNTPLTSLDNRVRDDIPEDVRDKTLMHCRHCDQVYWEGAHVRRMRRRLQHWDEQGENPVQQA